MTAHRCAVLDDYQNVAADMADWSSLLPEVAVDFIDRPLTAGERAEALAPYSIVVAMRERTPFDAELLSRLPNLKLLVTTGMGNAAIDMDAARRHGIVVSGTRGSVGPAAELAWGLLLAVMRHIPDEQVNFSAGGDRWQLTLGRDLKGKTLGVVGLGKLGSLVAGYGRAFNMRVLGWSRSNTPERSAELGVEYRATLAEMLPDCDVVSLHLTLTPETRGIIGAQELSAMKRDAVIINTSRGPLIDEAALIAALKDGRIGGAGLDVFDAEPLPADHPFRTLPTVVCTPHLGYVTRETYAIYYRDAVDDICAFLAGEPKRILNASNP
ncbi:D-2-hydroxyacid dehydrogenase family protein [Amorphus orientalis]|uniref:Phosphoglycerate dehydrogenase-like enzyme n=1 Tax=Amorphus orientalis TaxID=649198 RepID=A0AAE4AT54_9HYPH|nr:D-2-hydroxyacid dehydrogenase family protein [Amorphus orientalis]MDQ0315807.1 phosphoglycerate dehydrogenase-like enzyme [Amorphus orientalis]